MQILKAVGQKVLVSSSVDLDEVAAATDGYSGADLQALLYNAHLEVIHASLADSSHRPDGQMTLRQDETPIKYTFFGGPKMNRIVSKAEEMAFQRRVSVKRVLVLVEIE